jgi:hypothetical protein
MVFMFALFLLVIRSRPARAAAQRDDGDLVAVIAQSV